ncbi:MAG: 2-oxo acid dehydrogenase subunit E2 [Proteobacteria bacterium]|nr:2-oxo acid dehydrogenase subunit E2 [Pseudomonadota bacterium]
MSREFRMPSLGADMEAGTLVEWRVVPGARVRRGDVVALVETEKGIIDIESYEDGIVERLTVAPGARVPVGTPLALFQGEAAAPAPEMPRPAATAAAASSGTVPAAHGIAVPGLGSPRDAGKTVARAAPSAQRLRASPAARVRAAALGVDLGRIQGSGPQGVVTLQDVERIGGREPAPRVATPEPPGGARAGMRNAIAAAMGRSKREIPHYYLQLAMDMQPAVNWLTAFNQERPVPERLLIAVLLIKAAALAAAEKPGFSGYFRPAGFEPAAQVHMGVAIAVRGGGLVAPAIFEADRKSLATIMHELQDLVGRVRAGHMRSSEISSATLTVTSLGEEGVDVLYPVIYPPQVAIVGFGSVLERPWAVNGRLEARPVLNITLAADHRVTDGRQGAQFLARIRDHLARPGEL